MDGGDGRARPQVPARPHRHVGVHRARYPPELVRYLRADGRAKVMFGSNWPMIPPARALEHLDALELDDETRERFLEGNARAVFGV